MRKIKLILSQSEKGGCGKSTVLQAIVAGLTADGRKVLVVDADDGNSGYIRACGQESAVPLAWSVGADGLQTWLNDNLADHDTLAIDCGANIIASGAPINEFLGEFVMQTGEAGGSVTVFAIASTNAAGTGRLVRQMRDAYGSVADVRLIQNDQDGSGAFSRALGTLGIKTARFPHISPGFQAARLLTRAPLLDVLNSPPSGYTTAMAAYALNVSQFIADPAIVDLTGDTAAATLAALASGAPGPLRKVVYKLSEANDAALYANHQTHVARIALGRKAGADRANLSAIGAAALVWLAAEEAYTKTIR